MWSACPIFSATSIPVFISFPRKTLAKELVNDIELEYESCSPDPPVPSNFPTLYRPSTRTKLGCTGPRGFLGSVNFFREVLGCIVGNKISRRMEDGSSQLNVDQLTTYKRNKCYVSSHATIYTYAATNEPMIATPNRKYRTHLTWRQSCLRPPPDHPRGDD
jgi:hypothetical protein